MLSRRIPPVTTPNAWSLRLAARRAAGLPVADLTATNPTRCGLSPLAEAGEILARWSGVDHAPDALGGAAARSAIARYHAGRGLALAPADIALTASTSEAYAQLFRLLADPGQSVLAPAPGYPLLEPLARAEGVELRPYRLAYDGRWHLDRDSLERAAPGAKAVIVVEPNHPTGSCLDAGERAFVEDLCARHGLALIADEVFGEFPRPPATAPFASWLGERRHPTFVLGGLSKLCGLPQLKLAWIAVAGPAPARREAMAGLEWLGDLFLSVGAPVQAALPELLELRESFVSGVRARIAANLAALDELVRERPEFAVLVADGGWSAVLRVPATRGDEAWALALLDRGVAIHPGHFYDFAAGEHLAASLIVETGTFAAAITELANVPVSD